MTTAARSTVAGTGDSRKIRPTSARERKWGKRALGHALRGESAEIDDPSYTSGPCLLGEDVRGAAVGVLEIGAGSEGVHQVVGDVDAAHGCGDRRGVRDVPANRLGVAGPGMVTESVR